MTPPPDWVMLEAAKRSGWVNPRLALEVELFTTNATVRALCDMIQKYEKPPVDRKLLCAREAVSRNCKDAHNAARWSRGDWDGDLSTYIFAIELYEQGFGQ